MKTTKEQLYHAVQQKLLDFKNKVNLTELNFILLGFSKAGKQRLPKSQDTWEYSYQNIPGGLEFVARYAAINQEPRTPDPRKLGIDLGSTLELGQGLSHTVGCTKHIQEFARNVPNWPELGFKPKWGKWKFSKEVSNTWNVAALSVLYTLEYGEEPHFTALHNTFKDIPYTRTCQINLCLGSPGVKNTVLSQGQREQLIQDLREGRPANQITEIDTADIATTELSNPFDLKVTSG